MNRSSTALLLIVVAGAGCGRPQADRRPGAREQTALPGAPPTDGRAAAARPRPTSATQPPRPAKPMAPTGAGMTGCRALYRKRLVDLIKPLGRLGVRVTADELVELYGLDQDHTLAACGALTPEQRACVDQQPNPLLADQACRLPTPLSLVPPPRITGALTPGPVAVPPAAAQRQLAGLAGTWVRGDLGQGRGVKLVIGPGGASTRQRYRQGKPDGPPDRITFQVAHQLALQERRGATTLTHVYFRLGPNRFALSGNELHNVIRLRDRQRFRLRVTADRVLVVAGERCHVVDLGHLFTVGARCRWVGDALRPELRVDYRLGHWPVRHRYVLLQGHLLHHRLLERRYVRQ